MKNLTIAVGKPFPVGVPLQEGVSLNLSAGGLSCIMQFPDITKDEKWAFKKGFKRYGYFESSTSVPIPIITFEYQQPIGIVDCNFDAKLVNPEYIKSFLNVQIKNALDIYLLDGRIVKAIRRSGLEPDFIRLMQSTIKKQLALDYNHTDFVQYLTGLYNYSSEEIFKMGTIFYHQRKQTVKRSKTDTTTPAQKIIEQCLGNALVPGTQYHTLLPANLAQWYCYPADCGHSILCVLKMHYKKGMNYTDYLVPVSVKTVLQKGYEVTDGVVIVDLPYSEDLGVIDLPENYEY